MMRKLGRLIQTLHQLCYAHVLQLVIHDLFVKKHTSSTEITYSNSSETEEFDEKLFEELEDVDWLTIIGNLDTEQ